jgi:hypothetical protein
MKRLGIRLDWDVKFRWLGVTFGRIVDHIEIVLPPPIAEALAAFQGQVLVHVDQRGVKISAKVKAI